jgi:hypothetical protein
MMAVRAVHGRSNITNTSDGIGGKGRKSVDLAQQFIEVFIARRERPDTLNRGRGFEKCTTAGRGARAV